MTDRTRADELAEDAVDTDGLHEDIVTLAEGYLHLRTELARVTKDQQMPSMMETTGRLWSECTRLREELAAAVRDRDVYKAQNDMARGLLRMCRALRDATREHWRLCRKQRDDVTKERDEMHDLARALADVAELRGKQRDELRSAIRTMQDDIALLESDLARARAEGRQEAIEDAVRDLILMSIADVAPHIDFLGDDNLDYVDIFATWLRGRGRPTTEGGSDR